MTTYIQLDKYAKTTFIPHMQGRGFKHYKTFQFSKILENGIHYFISSQIYSSKERVRITPFLWIPEFEPSKESPVYPKNVQSIRASFPNYDYPDWPSAWPIKDEAECVATFELLISQLDQFVIPWFEKVKTGHDLMTVLNPGEVRNFINKPFADKYP